MSHGAFFTQELDEILAKRNKNKKKPDEKVETEEKTTLHCEW